MYNPVSTLRIQFNKSFNFEAFEKRIPFIASLGIRTIYASPIFKAVPGSAHGYDVVNPLEINPEIGTESQLLSISSKLKNESIGWLQDIVPNHMAYHHANPWLWDVLEKGPRSVYAEFFDITWASDFFRSRLMAPFLEASLAEVVAAGKITIEVLDSLVLRYADMMYPLNLRSYLRLLENARPQTDSMLQFLARLREIQKMESAVQVNLAWLELLRQFQALLRDTSSFDELSACIEQANNNPQLLHEVVDMQHYRLCAWTETSHAINYRRFFTVNGLIGLNMQNDRVFDTYHRYIKRLVNEKVFQGVRVDHIDGLYDPRGYLVRLRQLLGADCYIIVEKILESGEDLDRSFPVQGTTGYEFLSLCNNLFTFRKAEGNLNRFYEDNVDSQPEPEKELLGKKELMLSRYLGGELSNLSRTFSGLVAGNGELTDDMIRGAIGEFMVQCPTYRFYGTKFPLPQEERKMVAQVIEACSERRPEFAPGCDALEEVLFERPKTAGAAFNNKVAAFYSRLMQCCGPLMAKGVEDTFMYTFNRLVTHNEVGDSPLEFGLSVNGFHHAMTLRRKQWPLALNATATHDTKRGEDVRARLNVLTEFSSEWTDIVENWFKLNAPLRHSNIDRNDEYFIYQSIVGTYEGVCSGAYRERLELYMRKALREAKRHSTWEAPDTAYENAVMDFLRNILKEDSAFIKTLTPFIEKIAFYGRINSLVQVLLKVACPGIPDIYQGSISWDFSLVDPDNRRSIDFDQLQRLSVQKDHDLENGQVHEAAKLELTASLLRFRSSHGSLFSFGEYVPLTITGRWKSHVIAFARVYKAEWVIVAAPLHFGRLSSVSGSRDNPDWEDTAIILPFGSPGTFQQVLSRVDAKVHDDSIWVAELFISWPVALLYNAGQSSGRRAGVLLHPTSLPSPFPIGDLGPSAREFADFLFHAKQSLWQWLPVNPVQSSTRFSPYSSYSSVAGNWLLISPEDLVAEGLLDLSEVGPGMGKATTNYSAAAAVKQTLLTKAWNSFKRLRPVEMVRRFNEFAEMHSNWLDDFALFEVIASDQNEPRWWNWPTALRVRDTSALNDIRQRHAGWIDRQKWLQFVFFRQMEGLRSHCHKLDITLVGDMPFYISDQSADVWRYPHLFSVDVSGMTTHTAGVPPDYFSSEGQNWNVPVYDWEAMREEGYKWWLERFRINLQFFDLIRLDHFRAFEKYWTIDAGGSAKTGRWVPGPGYHFFEVVKSELGRLPFIAEDLGDIGAGVLELRDRACLPGMKVLQFGFGDDFPFSPHLPHQFDSNAIVYTGTHDNNTTREWFATELDDSGLKRLKVTVGQKVNQRNVAGILIRLAYGSVSNDVVIPMQDLLNLKGAARMNKPGTGTGNWTWRIKEVPLIDGALCRELARNAYIFGRIDRK
jgi:malto-oligosyltrehalose synthase/4-alpha-glucanotransferase